jgi:hypothetical protein
MQETPYTFTGIDKFDCGPNRGSATNPMFLVNHWLRTGGQPDPTAAGKTNSQAVLTNRFRQCADQRGVVPNLIAVDFFGIGDIVKTCAQLNAAIAAVTKQNQLWDTTIDELRSDPDQSPQQVVELDRIPRLPTMSETDARALLGPIANKLKVPDTDVGAIDDDLTPDATPTPTGSPTR